MDLMEKRVLELQTEIEYLRSLVVILSVYALPDKILVQFIEDLGTPFPPQVIDDEKLRISTSVMDRLASKLVDVLTRKRQSQG